MNIKYPAYSVHALTATGAVFAMLAMLAAADGRWGLMFVWLVVAFVVDGIDGPLARKYHVKQNAPLFDGQLLDLIIDYLTYVFIPAFALFKSGLLPGWTGWIVIFVITFTSSLYFAISTMKTKDGSFMGFPGCWNMVIIVLFTVQPQVWITLIIVALLSVAMFLPLRFVHPTRTKRWRNLTLPIALAWTLLAGTAAWLRFDLPDVAHWAFIASSLYLLLAGIAQQIIRERS